MYYPFSAIKYTLHLKPKFQSLHSMLMDHPLLELFIRLGVNCSVFTGIRIRYFVNFLCKKLPETFLYYYFKKSGLKYSLTKKNNNNKIHTNFYNFT